jgi:hypothetical protein
MSPLCCAHTDSSQRRGLSAGPDLGDFVTGKELTDVYSVEAPSYKVSRAVQWQSMEGAPAP